MGSGCRAPSRTNRTCPGRLDDVDDPVRAPLGFEDTLLGVDRNHGADRQSHSKGRRDSGQTTTSETKTGRGFDRGGERAAMGSSDLEGRRDLTLWISSGDPERKEVRSATFPSGFGADVRRGGIHRESCPDHRISAILRLWLDRSINSCAI